jgi:hypothetical protein
MSRIVHGVNHLLTSNAVDIQRFAGAIEIEALVTPDPSTPVLTQPRRA